jgi:flagellar biosynthetic protein FliO
VSNRGRTIATLLVALAVSGGSVGLAAQAEDPNEAVSAQAEIPEKIASAPAEEQGSFLNDPNLTGQSDLSLGSGELFVKMMLSLVLVVALAVAALYLSKRVLPKVTKASGKEIHVRETAYIGPRKALHLVEIGNQKLLIGSTNESITTLAHIGDAWLDLSKSETENTVGP